MYIVTNASQGQMDHVHRSRLVESGGARDDSPSWNLSRAKQGNTIQVDGVSPQYRRQKLGASECSKHKAKPLNESAAGCTIKENDVRMTRGEFGPISEEE